MYSSTDAVIDLKPLTETDSFNTFANSSSPWLIYKGNSVTSECTGSQDVYSCQSFIRMYIILAYYKEWINARIIDKNIENEVKEEQKTDKNSMYDFINDIFDKTNKYSNTKLINDYHHLIDNHLHQFEDIYNEINKRFNKTKTFYFVERNYRNKNAFNKETNYKLYFTNNIKDICIQQLLDTILCYFIFPYDFGFKLNIETVNKVNEWKQQTAENKQKHGSDSLILNAFRRASLSKKSKKSKIPISDNGNDKANRKLKNIFHWVKSNRNKMRDSISNNELYNEIYKIENNKFMNIIKYNVESDEKYEINTFNNGYRYHYDRKYEGNDSKDVYNIGYTYKDFYVSCKYKTLKEELLQSLLTIEQWDEIFETGNNYLKSKICKKMKAERRCKKYKRGSIITKDHLVSILLYTNYKHIEYELNKCFYNKSIERVSYICNLCRYLTESVQYFGKKMNTFNKKTKYFHIINKSTNIPISIKYYNAPLSVTTSNIIAINVLHSYNNSNGLLLQIAPSKGVHYFNCKWFSNYTNESEILFCYCQKPIIIENIIDIHIGINYYSYLYSFAIICNLLNGSDMPKNISKSDADMKVINIFYSFLYWKFYGKYNPFVLKNINNKSLPVYIEQLLNSYFMNTKQIEIRWSKMSQSIRKINRFGFKKNSFNRKVLSLILPFICYYKMEWIKWHLIIKAFKNVECIVVNGIKLTTGVFEDILFHIKNMCLNNSEYKHYKLNTIVFKNCKQSNFGFVDAKMRYNSRFIKLKWEFKNFISLTSEFEIHRITNITE